MRKKTTIVSWIILCGIGLMLWYSLDQILNQAPPEERPTVTIAAWNLEVFGQAKAAKQDLLQDYASIIDDFDIVFIQEIRDKNETAFQALCDYLPDYTCNLSSRAGRSASKEQYGLLYRNMSLATGKRIVLQKWQDYNPDQEDRWERPPLAVTFDVEGYLLTAHIIHVKPADVEEELSALEELVVNEGNTIILGDLNADCDYYNARKKKEFGAWHWIIRDEDDTTVGKTSCAYDRILLNDDAFEEYGKKGIVAEGIAKEHTDHYLVWVGLEPEE